MPILTLRLRKAGWSDAWEHEARNRIGEWIGLGDDEERVSDLPSEGLVAAGKELAARLTPEETEATRHYTIGGYRDLNEGLISGQPLSSTLQEEATALDRVIAEAPELPPKTVAYRGLQLGPDSRPTESEAEYRARLAEWAVERFPVGSMISGLGYQSTSIAIEPALDASLGRNGLGVILEIVARRGAYLGSVSHFDDEYEILMARGTEFRVLRVVPDMTFLKGEDYTESHRTVIQVEQV